MEQRKRVTKARADRVISAIVDLIECENFQAIAARAGYPQALVIFDTAADVARAMRGEAPHKYVTTKPSSD